MKHYAPLVVKKKVKIPSCKEEEQEAEYRSIDLGSAEQGGIRNIEAEYIGLEYL